MRFRLSAIAVIVAFSATVPALGQVGALEYSICNQDGLGLSDKDLDLQIFSCSRVISDTSLPKSVKAAALERRGFAYYLRNMSQNSSDRSLALSNYTEALRIDSNNADFYGGRAEVQLGTLIGATPTQIDIQRALPDLNQAIRLNPNKTAFLWNRALVLGEMLEFDAAFADLDKAKKLAKDKLEIQENLPSQIVRFT